MKTELKTSFPWNSIRLNSFFFHCSCLKRFHQVQGKFCRMKKGKPSLNGRKRGGLLTFLMRLMKPLLFTICIVSNLFSLSL